MSAPGAHRDAFELEHPVQFMYQTCIAKRDLGIGDAGRAAEAGRSDLCAPEVAVIQLEGCTGKLRMRRTDRKLCTVKQCMTIGIGLRVVDAVSGPRDRRGSARQTLYSTPYARRPSFALHCHECTRECIAMLPLTRTDRRRGASIRGHGLKCAEQETVHAHTPHTHPNPYLSVE